MVGIYGEILFENDIQIDKYLERIIVRQLPKDILDTIGKDDKTVYDTVIDMDKIPERFKKYIMVQY